MTFYISCRPIYISRSLVTPKDHFKKNFPGLDFIAKLIAWNRAIDGRMLYEITLSSEYTTEEANELKAMFIESLSIYGVHEKTLSSAQSLANHLTGCTVNIVDDKLEVEFPESAGV